MSISFRAATRVPSENVPPSLGIPVYVVRTRQARVDIVCTTPVLRKKEEIGSPRSGATSLMVPANA